MGHCSHCDTGKAGTMNNGLKDTRRWRRR
jgi:hypothetical protein